MEGYKFDLRIYILVTSCDPLRIFLYKDGLVRMGTEKYHAPTEANLVSHWLTIAKMIRFVINLYWSKTLHRSDVMCVTVDRLDD